MKELNNIKHIKEYLKGNLSEECFQINILRRRKDSGNESMSKHVEKIGDYKIITPFDLDNLMPKIKQKCIDYNARAYIALNFSHMGVLTSFKINELSRTISTLYREESKLMETYWDNRKEVKKISEEILKLSEKIKALSSTLISEDVLKNYDKVKHLFLKHQITKYWIIDVDAQHLDGHSSIKEELENAVRADYETRKNPIENWEPHWIPTVSGSHLVVKPFDVSNLKALKRKLHKKELPIIQVQKDANTLLYAIKS